MLRETQTALALALLGGDAEATTGAAGRIRAGKLGATRRLEVYRHNVYANLRGVLRDVYPVIFALVGDAFFMHAAELFVKTHPSGSGDLHRFGGEWATFLGTYPYAKELPYLPDVARLEWAWHEAFHAGDAAPLDPARLAAVPADEHADLRFVLHPAVRLTKSDFPTLRIWEVNQPAFTGEVEVDWDAPVEMLLIRRDLTDGVSVLIEPLRPANYAFLRALQRHATLDAATTAALGEDAAFNLQGFLLESVQSAVIADFTRE